MMPVTGQSGSGDATHKSVPFDWVNLTPDIRIAPSQVPQLPWMSLPEASELGNLIKWLPNCNPRICNQPSYLSQNLVVGIFHKEPISMLGNMKESLSKMDTIVTHDKNDTLWEQNRKRVPSETRFGAIWWQAAVSQLMAGPQIQPTSLHWSPPRCGVPRKHQFHQKF